jgi:mono/diheme cytochrome c family protein
MPLCGFSPKFKIMGRICGVFLLASGAARAEGEFRLKAILHPPVGEARELKSWSLPEFKTLKQVSSREKDPRSGAELKWQGVLLSTVLEKAMAELRPEERAQVDLVILRSESGAQALVPRGFVVKYPLMLAYSRERQGEGDLGTLFSVAPWTSKPKIRDEGLPLETLFLNHVQTVELGSYQSLYGSLFLKRRTDPAAVRGEKLFVQNCLACHGTGKGPSVSDLMNPTHEQKTRTFAGSAGHSNVMGLPKMTDRDRRALTSYLDSHKAENPGGAAVAGASASR